VTTVDAYGDAAAEIYDERFAPKLTDGHLGLLTQLAQGGRVLDVGAGTGRAAIPLAAAGIPVTAVEVSARMCDVLRERTRDLGVVCIQADVAEVAPSGGHTLAICLFNTLFMVGDRTRQARTLENVATALEPGGRLLVEAFVPDPDRFGPNGESVRVRSVDTDGLVMQCSLHDAAQQRIDGHDMIFRGGAVSLVPYTMHYLWPEQQDELAAVAGLVLEERCADWERGRQINAGTRNAVSVYRKESAR
jgi:SAM-dependent methyltransferase